MGGSALCCVSQGVQEQGCWGAKPLQLIDLISTRGPGPPLVTEIHITHALLHLTNRSEVKLLHRGPYIFFASGQPLLGETWFSIGRFPIAMDV